MAIFEVEEVLSSKWQDYRSLIPKDSFQHMKKNEDKMLFVIAKFNHNPIGIIAVKLNDILSANLIYMFVQRKFRRFGIGTNLLSKVEKLLLEKGIVQLHSNYVENQYSKDLEEFFLSNEFEINSGDQVVIKIDISNKERTMQFINKYKNLPEGFSTFLWRELIQSEKRLIQEGENIWYPDFLSPFKEEENIDYETSVGVKYGEEVVGWMITKQTSFEVLEYATYFLHARFRKQGVGAALPAKTIELHQKKFSDIPYIYLRVDKKNQNMLDMTKNCFANYADLEIKENKRAKKFLNK